MTRLLRIALCLLSVPATTSLLAQDTKMDPPSAQVTFYSTGGKWKGGMPGYKSGSFRGDIFDRDHGLAHITPGHFVTFKLAPGRHRFYLVIDMPGVKNNQQSTSTNIILEENHHYYMGTYVKTGLLLGIQTPRIEQTNCEDAQEHARAAKPLDSKLIAEDIMPLVVSESAFPSCSEELPSIQKH